MTISKIRHLSTPHEYGPRRMRSCGKAPGSLEQQRTLFGDAFLAGCGRDICEDWKVEQRNVHRGNQVSNMRLDTWTQREGGVEGRGGGETPIEIPMSGPRTYKYARSIASQ